MPRQRQETIENLVEKMEKHFELKEHEEVEKVATQILEREPGNEDALKYRGNSRRMLGKSYLALMDLSEANRLRPNDEYILRTLGSVQFDLGDLENAIKSLNQSLQLDSTEDFTFRELGRAYSWKGNYEEALKYLNEAHKLDPNNWWTFWRRGIVYRKLGKLKESLSFLNAALEIEPNRKLVRIDVADTFREMKLFEKALTILDGVDSKDYPDFDIVRAHIYIDIGNLKEAENCLKRSEPHLNDWMEIELFQEIRKLLNEKKESTSNTLATDILLEDSKREPAKVLEEMTKSINNLKLELTRVAMENNLEKMNQIVAECSKTYQSESGAGIVLELKKNVVELKQENEILKHQVKEKDTEVKEHERRLQCMICMDKPRDTAVMPCMHFLFCHDCIHEHNKLSKQCPSCRQSTTGVMICLLEGAEPIRKNKKENEGKKEKENGNK